MALLSRKTMLAIEAVTDIAYNGGDRAVQSGEIAGRLNIPQRYLEPVLQELVRSAVLVGVRGPRGGYRLGRERRLITLGEIAALVMALEERGEGVDQSGSELGRSVVRPALGELEREWLAKLATLTIDDMVARARAAGVRSRAAVDFTI